LNQFEDVDALQGEYKSALEKLKTNIEACNNIHKLETYLNKLSNKLDQILFHVSQISEFKEAITNLIASLKTKIESLKKAKQENQVPTKHKKNSQPKERKQEIITGITGKYIVKSDLKDPLYLNITSKFLEQINLYPDFGKKFENWLENGPISIVPQHSNSKNNKAGIRFLTPSELKKLNLPVDPVSQVDPASQWAKIVFPAEDLRPIGQVTKTLDNKLEFTPTALVEH
jgi:hypothetical protein